VALQSVESRAPEPAVRREPGVELGQRLRPQRVEAPPAVGPDFHEPRLAEDAEVLRRPRLGQAELVDELADRPGTVAHEVQDAPPVRLGEGVEHRCRHAAKDSHSVI
jgi:hypothetical protein